MTTTDIETIEHLDFQFAPPCEAKDLPDFRHRICNGNNPAEWRIVCVCPCPPHVRLYCDSCLKWKLETSSLTCYGCKTDFSPPIKAYKSITRL